LRPTLIHIVFLALSSTGFAQFYVQEGTEVSLENPHSILSIQGNVQINASIKGQGTLVLNGSFLQTLESTQNILVICNVMLENASLVHINTPLRVEHQFTICSGVLRLEHPLYLPNQAALVLLQNSAIEPFGLLLYDLQIKHQQPLLVWSQNNTSKYRNLNFNGENHTIQYPTNQSKFGTIDMGYEVLYIQLKTPPPEIVLRRRTALS